MSIRNKGGFQLIVLVKVYKADENSRVETGKLAIMLFFAVFAEMLFEGQFLAFLNIAFLLHQSAVAPDVLFAQVRSNALYCVFIEDSPSLPLFFIEIEGIDHDSIQDDLLDFFIDDLFLHALEAFPLNKLIVFGLETMLIFFRHSRRRKQIEEHSKY